VGAVIRSQYYWGEEDGLGIQRRAQVIVHVVPHAGVAEHDQALLLAFVALGGVGWH
jgi:hypothetical protein